MEKNRAKPRAAKPKNRPAPSGAASFYLDAVGGALGTQPISLATVIDATPDAILFVDVERRIRFGIAPRPSSSATRARRRSAPTTICCFPDLKASGSWRPSSV